MANLNSPHGLKPLGICLSGGAPVIELLSKAVGYGTAIFRYDAINKVAGGTIEASATPHTTKYSGVALDYGAASTATDHLCSITPDALYEAQGDDATGNVAADMGLNADLVLTAGNTLTKNSKHQIDSSTKATGATLDVKLHRLLNVPDNEFGGYARIEISFNAHRDAPGVAGV